MLLAKKSQVALSVIVCLDAEFRAAKKEGRAIRFIQIYELSREVNCEKKYLELIVRLLRQKNFIEARRGCKGGYRIHPALVDVYALEIVRTCQWLNESLLKVERCSDLTFGEFMERNFLLELEQTRLFVCC